jgi:hypothetical protein
MANFKRGMTELLLNKLKHEELFKSKLLPDMEKGEVFFAIRHGYCSFYHRGSSLFSYDDGGFSTHIKFGFVPRIEKESYITEDRLRTIGVETSFKDSYDKIKERAAKYSGIEAEGVSALYYFAPAAKNKDERYFLVDIEVFLDSAKDKENQSEESQRLRAGQIDILLYDNLERRLLFCEAKHFSNGELWAGEGRSPKVVEQLEKYNMQIASHETAILDALKNTFEEYNILLGTNLSAPTSVCPKCGLLVFGFDNNQKDKIRELLIDNGNLKGYNHYAKGGIRDINLETLFNRLNTSTAEEKKA